MSWKGPGDATADTAFRSREAETTLSTPVSGIPQLDSQAPTSTPAGGRGPSDASESLVGQLLLGQYRILSELGEGGFGTVYLSDQVRVGSGATLQRAVVKVLKGGHLISPEIVQRVEQEADVLAKLRHQHLVTLYAAGVLPDGRPFLAMEYGGDITLAAALKEAGRFDVDSALSVAEQIADGLTEVHYHGIVHRDLKPLNILLSRRSGDWWVKIVDLGIAKILEQITTSGNGGGLGLTRSGMFVGSVPYASPEQLTGTVDARSDLWSLGVTLFELLVGERPFKGNSAMELMHAIVMTPTPNPVEIGVQLPRPVLQLLRKALEKEPAKRFQSAQEMRDAIVALRRTQSQDRADKLLGSARRRFRPWVVAAGVGAVCATLCAIGAVAWVRPARIAPPTPMVAAAPAPPVKLMLRSQFAKLHLSVDDVPVESSFARIQKPEGTLKLTDAESGWTVSARYKRNDAGIQLSIGETTPALTVSVDKKPVGTDAAIEVGSEARTLAFRAPSSSEELVVLARVDK